MDKAYTTLKYNIIHKKIHIGIVGLGYVGLPLALLFAKNGFTVTGFTKDEEKAKNINDNNSPIRDMDIKKKLEEALLSKRFSAKKLVHKALTDIDAIIICLPTPTKKNKKPDLSYLKQFARLLSKVDLTGKLLINESTVAPLTTRQLFGKLGGRYFLVSSPERIDPGNREKTTEHIAKIVGGSDIKSTKLGVLLYKSILQNSIIAVDSIEVTEMAKMLENSFRAVNIALINEFAILSEQLNIDIVEVISAASSKWTFIPHYPSIGVGGHCIPVDPYYILDLAKKYNKNMGVVKNSLLVNEKMPLYIFQKFLSIYKKGMNVLVYGLTYKKNVDDLRESPSLYFCNLLKEREISFFVYDPCISIEEIKKINLQPGTLRIYDIVIIATDHHTLQNDLKSITSSDTIIIDGRNAIHKKEGQMVLGIGRSFK